MKPLISPDRSPEQRTYARELSGLLEKALLTISEDYRVVFMLRDVEGMSTEETAQCLHLTQENVKVRLHRAHAALRKQLCAAVGTAAPQCFQFHASRCDRVVRNVVALLGSRE